MQEIKRDTAHKLWKQMEAMVGHLNTDRKPIIFEGWG